MRHTTVLLIAVAMLAASCSSGTTDTAAAAVEAAPTTIASTVTATVPVTTTTVDQTTTTPSALDSGVTVSRDIVYLEMNGHEYLVDVYVPPGDGPWPVVVALHGATVYKSHVAPIGEAAAEAGMLVFAPNYVAAWPSLGALDANFIRTEDPAQRCALAFAEQEASSYSGDPDRTVVYGMSGGSSFGAALLLQPTTDLAPGCLAQTLPMAPVGGVLGDAEYFNHNGFWDAAFNADPGEMQRIVAETVDSALWTGDMPTRVRLWAAEGGSFPRSFDDPWDEDGWFALRDPDGSIRDDLDELGELDDSVISYIDSGLLLATRLQQAGIDATFDTFAGGHTHSDKIPELVAYLLDAAGTE